MSFEWRPARPDEAEALHRVLRESQRHDGDPEIQPVEDLEQDLTSERVDLETDTVVATHDGMPVAFGFLHCSEEPGPTHHFAWLFCSSDPAHRAAGVDQDLFERMCALGETRLRREAHAVPKFLRMGLHEAMTEAHNRCEDAGFEVIRYFDVMAHDLAELPELQPVRGVDVVGWTDDLVDASLDAHNAAFAHHWGSAPQSLVQWRGNTAENQFLRRDLTFVALDGDTVAAYLLASVWPDERPDVSEAYADTIGTRPEYRGRGLASHLIARFLHAAAADPDITQAGLDVDSDSLTGARAIYERQGFRLHHRQLQYARPVS
jgi:mycothiol synthase